MADPWLAHEVLRELDQAGACYFALTLRSAPSSTYLEIPAAFTAETGWPATDECALVTSINFAREWPLQLRRYSDVHSGVSAVSVGGGWAKFVADHQLGDGAFLTFEVVDERSLVVALHARGAVRRHQRGRQSWIGEAACQHAKSDNVPVPEDNVDPPLAVRGADSEGVCDGRPQFQKTLRKTHMKKNDGGRLDVPTLYWRSQGVEAFDGKWYTLYGPLSRGPVKTATHSSLKQRCCSFTKGFAGNQEANGLKLGDELQFTKVGLLEYDVRKV